jgi:signal transduction histidine kinase/DNA-binding NarL/FixJ family response regulator
MNRSVITFLIYTFAVISVIADTTSIEKSEKTGENNADSVRFGEFMALSKGHFPDSVQLAHEYADSAMSIAQKNKNPMQMGLAEERYGFLYKIAGDFENAELHLNTAADIFHNNQDYSKTAWIKKILADIKMETGDYVESMNLYVEASKLAEEANDIRALAFCYRGISYLYYQYHEPVKSLENIQNAYTLLIETDYDTLDLADMLHTLAIALGSNDQLDSAISCYELAAQYNKMYDKTNSLAGNLNNIALIYENRGMYEEALSYYLQCLKIDTQVGDNLGLTFSHIGLANVYFKPNQLDNALYHAQQSFQIANSIDALQRIQKAGESLIMIFKELGQYDSSLYYYEIITNVKDSLYKRAKIRESYELQTKYETEKKEREILLLTEQKESAEFRRNTYIFIGIAISFFLLLLYNQQRLRNRKNKQLLEKEKEMDRLKSRFFANISHEFRTPLTLILSPLDDMISKIETPDINKRLKVIKRNAGRLLDLVNQLLDLSKIESGKLRLIISRSDIISLIKGVSMSFHSIAEQKNIELTLDVLPEQLEMNYDREKMETILINLLSNAFKFTPDNGKIHIQSEIYGMKKSSGDREFLKIMVSDSGNGVPAKEMDQIFDRFYQSDNNQLLQQEGSGIGLALTKELVELHKGSISAESSHGKGMRIIFQIPTDLESSKLPDSGNVISPQGNLLIKDDDFGNELEELKDLDTELPQILLIEDHKDVRKYIQEILEDNYRVFIAEDGETGIESAMELIPDLVLSDVMMPKKNGYEVCRVLKNDEKTSHIPIVLLTAKSDTEDKIVGLHTRADDYITKPFIPRELLARIKNLIESRNQLKERYKKKGIIKPKEIAVNSIDEKFLNRLIEIVERYIGNEKFGVEQLGEELGMSRSQLHRKLTALLDTGPNQFIRQFRLQRAYDLLKQNSATASEISYQVGFGSPSYFTKCFHEHFGYPPSEVLVQIPKILKPKGTIERPYLND